MPASYNGWTASRSPAAIGVNTDWEPLPGHKFPGGIKSGDVEVVMTYVVRQLDKRVEPIDRDAIKDEWGWFYKPSANSPDKLSCHSSGTAFDYNATRHPNGRRGTFTARQVAEIRRILAEVDGVVYWGGDRGTADEMHFEIHAGPLGVAAVAARLRRGTTAAPAAPKPPAPLPLEDDDVHIMTADGRPPRLVTSLLFTPLDGASAENYRKAGVPVVEVTPNDYDEARSQYLKATA